MRTAGPQFVIGATRQEEATGLQEDARGRADMLGRFTPDPALKGMSAFESGSPGRSSFRKRVRQKCRPQDNVHDLQCLDSDRRSIQVGIVGRGGTR